MGVGLLQMLSQETAEATVERWKRRHDGGCGQREAGRVLGWNCCSTGGEASSTPAECTMQYSARCSRSDCSFEIHRSSGCAVRQIEPALAQGQNSKYSIHPPLPCHCRSFELHSMPGEYHQERRCFSWRKLAWWPLSLHLPPRSSGHLFSLAGPLAPVWIAAAGLDSGWGSSVAWWPESEIGWGFRRRMFCRFPSGPLSWRQGRMTSRGQQCRQIAQSVRRKKDKILKWLMAEFISDNDMHPNLINIFTYRIAGNIGGN